MMRFLGVVVLALVLACGRRGAQQDTVDTAMVFVATPPSSSDTASTRNQMKPLMAAMAAYSAKRITADSAAKVIVHYMKQSGRSLNMDMDPPLQEAVTRELRKRPQ